MNNPRPILMLILMIAVQMYFAYQVGGTAGAPPVVLPEISVGFVSDLINNLVTTVDQAFGITSLFNFPLTNLQSGRSIPDILQVDGGGVLNLTPNILPQIYQAVFRLIDMLRQQVFPLLAPQGIDY